MKELSIGKKAKRYDGNYNVYTELINRLENVKNAIKKQNYGIAMDILCKPYPEFQITTSEEHEEKSKGDNIRKSLFEYFKNRKCDGDIDETWYGISYDEILDWLEKHGEQKPVNRLKITAGNWYVCEMEVMNENMVTAFHRDEIYYCPKDGYLDVRGALFEVGCLDVFRLATEKEIPQTKQEWSEDDEAILEKCIGAVKASCYSHSFKSEAENWLKSIKDRVQPQTKQEWKQENTDDLTDFENAMMHIGGSFFGENAGLDPNDTNAIREQANFLLELVSKQEWSEEDNYNYLLVLGIVREDPDSSLERKNRLHSWFKSLKDRYTWKPSDEQLNNILDVLSFDNCTPKRRELLESLYKQLKKL